MHSKPGPSCYADEVPLIITASYGHLGLGQVPDPQSLHPMEKFFLGRKRGRTSVSKDNLLPLFNNVDRYNFF
jgi:hypothetical protein